MTTNDASSGWTLGETLPRVTPGDVAIDVEGPRYELQRELGRGGHGVVQLVRDRVIGRELALKTRIGHRNEARFVREARIQGQLEHPAIVPVYDLGSDEDGNSYFSMKRLRGRTLRSIYLALRRGDPDTEKAFPRARLLQIFVTTCQALYFAHSCGVLHRDVKPANIMVGDFGEVYVLDWGLATMLEPDGDAPTERLRVDAELLNAAPPSKDQALDLLTQEGAILGTLGYLSPEQARGRNNELDVRADIYSLGVILFELLTLDRFHTAEGRNALLYATIKGTASAKARERAPEQHVPPELEAVCVKATALEPDDRYTDVRSLSEAIERYLQGDRDLERRRQLSENHTRRANELVEQAIASTDGSECARRDALREVGLALALDPEHREAARILYRIITTPPSVMPEEARREMRRVRRRKGRTRIRVAEVAVPISMAVVLIGVLWMGVRQPLVMWVLVLSQLCSALLQRQLVKRRVPYYASYVDVTLQMVTVACLGRVFGPLIMMPAFLTIAVCAMGMVGKRSLRVYGVFIAALTLVGSIGLEYLGVLPQSYRFGDGTIEILPTAVNLPGPASLIVLAASSLANILLPWAAMSRIREQVSSLEHEVVLHNWQLRQLLPEETPGGD